MTIELATSEDIQTALDAKSATKAEKGPTKRELRKAASAEKAATKAAEKAAAADSAETDGVPGTDYTMSPSAVVHFGEKDGKAYGPDNVPYRPDSNRAKRFALVTNGATVEDLGKAGLTPRRIRDMAAAGFIVITHPEPTGEVAPGEPAEVEDDAA